MLNKQFVQSLRMYSSLIRSFYANLKIPFQLFTKLILKFTTQFSPKIPKPGRLYAKRDKNSFYANYQFDPWKILRIVCKKY